MVPFTFSLFLEPLEAAFGWKREAISRTFAMMGRAFDKAETYLPSLVILFALPLVVAACFSYCCQGMRLQTQRSV
jgi:hypothetical protein